MSDCSIQALKVILSHLSSRGLDVTLGELMRLIMVSKELKRHVESNFYRVLVFYSVGRSGESCEMFTRVAYLGKALDGWSYDLCLSHPQHNLFIQLTFVYESRNFAMYSRLPGSSRMTCVNLRE